jgi:sulfur-carrier protein
VKVTIPSPLLSYTKEREVEADGRTLAELFADLDRKYPGFRFRVIDEQGGLRPHMRVFVNHDQARDMSRAIDPRDVVHLIQALSGG